MYKYSGGNIWEIRDHPHPHLRNLVCSLLFLDFPDRKTPDIREETIQITIEGIKLTEEWTQVD